MRIPKQFGKRTPFFESKQEPRQKYILVFEGEVTEVQYFDGLIEYKEDIGICPLIEVKPILRSYRERSHSSPMVILELLIEYMTHNLQNGIKVKNFINCIIDYLINEHEITDKSIYNIKAIEIDLEYLFFSELGLENESVISDIHQKIEEVAKHLKHSFDLIKNIDNILKYVQEQQIVYDPEVDKVCLIIDRDQQNFKASQYDSVIKKCNEEGFDLYVSNPCFEFWLLLHSPKVMSICREKMIQNKKSSSKSKKRFLEVELSKVFNGYKKRNINFTRFKDNIQLAIEQEKYFCEDIIMLKETLGTNVGLLLTELINK